MPTVTLRCLLTAAAWSLLARVKGTVPGELSVRVDRGDLAVTVAVHPPGVNCAERLPGNWLSPVERLIWDALAGGPLPGKTIASRTGQTFDSTFRVILRNLVNRQVIEHDEEGEGYRRAPVIGGNDTEAMTGTPLR